MKNNKKCKKIIQIDLDGVLNTYDGNYDANEIPPIKSGAYEFLKRLNEYFRIELFTVRDAKMCEKWLENNYLLQFFEKITNIKNPFATLILDDRALNFNGDFEETFEKIIGFKPYWK